MSEERIIAIDYGEKRIGIAITDPLMMFASPLDTLNNNPEFWKNFAKLVSAYTVREFVLGYPVKENGEKTKVTLLVEKFEEELKKRFKLPVFRVDERYSSSIAQERILESVKSKKKRRDKSLIDKNAAAVILEDHLRSIE